MVAVFPLRRVRTMWSSALDAAEAALRAADGSLGAEEVHVRHRRLNAERAATAELLDQLARPGGAR